MEDAPSSLEGNGILNIIILIGFITSNIPLFSRKPGVTSMQSVFIFIKPFSTNVDLIKF